MLILSSGRDGSSKCRFTNYKFKYLESHGSIFVACAADFKTRITLTLVLKSTVQARFSQFLQKSQDISTVKIRWKDSRDTQAVFKILPIEVTTVNSKFVKFVKDLVFFTVLG